MLQTLVRTDPPTKRRGRIEERYWKFFPGGKGTKIRNSGKIVSHTAGGYFLGPRGPIKTEETQGVNTRIRRVGAIRKKKKKNSEKGLQRLRFIVFAQEKRKRGTGRAAFGGCPQKGH